MFGSYFQPFFLQTNLFLNLEQSLGVALEFVKRNRLTNCIRGLLILTLGTEQSHFFSSFKRSHELLFGFFINFADFKRLVESSQLLFGFGKETLFNQLLNFGTRFFEAGEQIIFADNTRFCICCRSLFNI
ncbi:MAG: hypothetical protein ACD_39C01812G0002 [uncultured bacterium]|nr:MAG: hypothetical protein ACD_39C01812G0002 [uncultured bacterium]